MPLNALVAFLHHLAAFTVVGTLIAERVLFSPTPSFGQALRLRRIDAMYGASAGALLAVGLARVYWFEKGADYYLHNPFFLAKMALFITVGLLSIYPTVVFLSWRKAQVPVVTPVQAARIRRLLDLELAAIVAILFCAAFMAKGIGA
jgi:putative membrane protein